MLEPSRLTLSVILAFLLVATVASPVSALQSSSWYFNPSVDSVRPCYFGRNFTNVNTCICGNPMGDVKEVLKTRKLQYVVVVDAFAGLDERVGAESRRAASVWRFLVSELQIDPSLIVLRWTRLPRGASDAPFGVVTFTFVARGGHIPAMTHPSTRSAKLSASN